MSDNYSTENYASNFESNKNGLNDESSLGYYSSSNNIEKSEHTNFNEKDFDSLLSVIKQLNIEYKYGQ